MKIRISAAGFNLSAELERYTRRKLTQLTKKVPRELRLHALCDVHFVQTSKRGKKIKTCVIGLSLDDTKLRAEETTLHMYTALDIAVVHIDRQLKDYVTMRYRRSIFARIRSHLRRDWM